MCHVGIFSQKLLVLDDVKVISGQDSSGDNHLLTWALPSVLELSHSIAHVGNSSKTNPLQN